MSQEPTPTPDNSSVNSTITAVAGLVQAIPIYQDGLQPAVKEVGKSLELVAKVVSIALSPLRGVIWGYEKIEGFLNESVGEKLKNVPPENITTPAANIVGPAIEALKFSGEDINLRELYANLIANAMDKKTSLKVHPAFVEIIKTISSDEALIMKYFSENHDLSEAIIDVRVQLEDVVDTSFITPRRNYSLIGKKINLPETRIELVSSYLDNLCRLGLLEIPSGLSKATKDAYNELEANFEPEKAELEISWPEKSVTYTRKMVMVTNFGRMFIESVVKNKE